MAIKRIAVLFITLTLVTGCDLGINENYLRQSKELVKQHLSSMREINRRLERIAEALEALTPGQKMKAEVTYLDR